MTGFKNFHRLLCERFGYVHDECNWMRDQLSLIEHIANRALLTAPAPVQTEDLAGAVWDGPNTASQVDPCMALVSKR